MTFAELGLRERKRVATRNAIQRAVLTLAQERGYESVTVEEISHSAGISPRTFFNYFPTKEAAIVGDMPRLPPAEEIDAFVNGGATQTILDGIRDLLAGTADNEAKAEERDIHRLRRTVLKENPHLFSLRMASMRQLESELISVVERRLVADDPRRAADAETLHSRARLITYVAFAGIKHAWSCWAEHGGTGPLSARLYESFAELQAIGKGEW
jgi:Transcriptional regulator